MTENVVRWWRGSWRIEAVAAFEVLLWWRSSAEGLVFSKIFWGKIVWNWSLGFRFQAHLSFESWQLWKGFASRFVVFALVRIPFGLRGWVAKGRRRGMRRLLGVCWSFPQIVDVSTAMPWYYASHSVWDWRFAFVILFYFMPFLRTKFCLLLMAIGSSVCLYELLDFRMHSLQRDTPRIYSSCEVCVHG